MFFALKKMVPMKFDRCSKFKLKLNDFVYISFSETEYITEFGACLKNFADNSKAPCACYRILV